MIAVAAHDRALAATSSPGSPGTSRSRVSFEKCGYHFEQTDTDLVATLQLLAADATDPASFLESCEFTASSVRIRVSTPMTSRVYAWDVACLWGTIDPERSSARLQAQRRKGGAKRVLVNLAKGEPGSEWPRLRA